MSGEATRIEKLIAIGAVVLNDKGQLDCTHRTREARRRRIADGRTQVVNQCLICGDGGCVVTGGRNTDPELPEFNYALREQYLEERRSHRSSLLSQARLKAETDRVEGNRDYYDSTAWKSRHAKVMRRAGGVCECCLDRRAVQVHHTTYQNLGNEPCWDLRAICLECHGTFDGTTRARKG